MDHSPTCRQATTSHRIASHLILRLHGHPRGLSLYSMRLVQLLVLVACAVVSSVAANRTLPSAKYAHDKTTGTNVRPREWFRVFLPNNGLDAWFLDSRVNGPHSCIKISLLRAWAMLNAYRSGGKENVHWKYTTDENDPECLANWKYYESNGLDVIAESIPRTTKIKDSKRWCALPVYRMNGEKGKQWNDCEILEHHPW